MWGFISPPHSHLLSSTFHLPTRDVRDRAKWNPAGLRVLHVGVSRCSPLGFVMDHTKYQFLSISANGERRGWFRRSRRGREALLSLDVPTNPAEEGLCCNSRKPRWGRNSNKAPVVCISAANKQDHHYRSVFVTSWHSSKRRSGSVAQRSELEVCNRESWGSRGATGERIRC